MCLDDLERYLNMAELRPDWVTVLTSGGAIVVAAMRGSEYDKFATTGDLRHPQVGALEQFSLVRLRDDDPGENARLAEAVPADQRAAVRTVGLGAFLGGGPQARNRFDNNRDKHPLGCAYVRLAADWRRIGLTHITKPELEQLSPQYLPERLRHHPMETNDEALAWATATVDETVQLVQYGPDDTFTATDYILDHLTETSPSPSLAIWEAAVSSPAAPAGELFGVGVRAHHQGLTSVAIKAFRRCAASGDPDVAPLAATNLGILEREAGNLDAARTAYQQAITSGHPDIAPVAVRVLNAIDEP